MNIFKEYNVIENKTLQIIDENGKNIPNAPKINLEDKTVLDAYKKMLFARIADQMAIGYQRQGRMYTYPPNYGQEAVSSALGLVMNEDDWLVPAFRELGAYLAKGATLKELFLYFMGYEDGNTFKNAKNILPISVPIASQLVHATGIGYAINYNKEDKVVFTFVGDGGTSEGDFHEALNFAGVWKAPVIFIIQNNQYAISVPVSKQTSSTSLAIKSVAYGIKGIRVDGNDLFAMYYALNEASEYARKGNGPVLIEAVTYRLGAHTTSDDPTKYRSADEEESWLKKEPLKRLKSWLVTKKLWNDKEEEKIVGEYKKEVERQFSEAESYPAYKVEDVFKYMYTDMPDDLKKQQVEFEKFLDWKEAAK